MSSYILLFAFFRVRFINCDAQRFAFLIMLVQTIPDLTDNNSSTTAPHWNKWENIWPGHMAAYANIIYPTVDSVCWNSPYPQALVRSRQRAGS